MRIKIDIIVNIPDNLRSCATCPRILRAVHKTGYLRTGYCQKSNALLSNQCTQIYKTVKLLKTN